MTDRSLTLVLVRHAKSSWDLDVDDAERPLSSRGRRDAVAVGGYLLERQLVPDLVLCSPAVRTRQTWDRAVEGGATAGDVRYEYRVYHAWVPELVALVREVPETVRTLLVMGHAPGIPDLMEHLAVRRPDSKWWDQAEAKFATSGCAVIALPGPWREISRGQGELVSFHVPRG